MQYEKDNSTLEHMPNSIEQTLENSGNSKKFQTSVKMEETIDVLFCQMSCCWPFWMAGITKNHKNDYHGSVVHNSDLHQTPSTIKFGSIFNLNMLLAILATILDCSHYQISQK